MTGIRGSLEVRLWVQIDQSEPNGCWPWTGATVDGYGVIGEGGANGRKLRAHRVMWEKHNKRRIPKGKIVRHSCDNPPCCNPAHLVLGTHKQNVHDKIQRGRCYTGDHRGKNNKVTPAQVRRIRKAKGTQAEIGNRFRISQRAVSDILIGKTWSHVI
jgi:hypothetical protein